MPSMGSQTAVQQEAIQSLAQRDDVLVEELLEVQLIEESRHNKQQVTHQ